MVQLMAGQTLLFIGDSITDAGRRDYFGADLGQGYVNMLAGHLLRQYFMLQLKVLNKGNGGDTMRDLIVRWQEDCLDYNPDVITIEIGINDIWHRLSAGLEYTDTALEQYKENYSYLIHSAKERNPDVQLILMEPYVLPEPSDRLSWRPLLEKQIGLIETLAKESRADIVRLDETLNQAGKSLGYAKITGQDGVHPTTLGHALIANQWLRTTGL